MFNNFFSICNLNGSNGVEDKNKIYECCMDTCKKNSTEPKMCYSLCSLIYPPIVKDMCVFEKDCWKEGFFDKKCMEDNNNKISKCCTNSCEEYKIKKRQFYDLDCDKYCDDYSVGKGYFLQKNGNIVSDNNKIENTNDSEMEIINENYMGIM